MFRIPLVLYPRRGSQLITTVCSRSVLLSSSRFRNNDIGNFHDHSRVQKQDEQVEDRVSPVMNLPNLKLESHHLETSSPFKLFNSIEEVWNYIRSNPKIDSFQYRHIFTSIIKLYESGSTGLSAEEICRKEEFEAVVKNLENNVHFLKVDDAETILRISITLGISSNSLLCQKLLRLISKRIDRLKSTIPVVFEKQVRSRLDVDDLRTLVNAVCFAFSCASVSVETRKLLVDAALENVDQFELKKVSGMIKRLTFTENDPKNVHDLYRAFMTRLSENTHLLEAFDRIVTLPRVIITNYLDVHESFFNQEIIEEAIETVVRSNEFRPRETGKLLRHLNRISYYSPELLDYIDEQFKQWADIPTFPRALLVSFVMMCSNCSYKPKNWGVYEEKLVSFLEENKGHFPWYIVTDLLVLKCWPKALVEYCFREDLWCEPSDDDELGKHVHYRIMLTTYQVVKLLYSNHYTGSYPSASTIDTITEILYTDREYPLLDSLEVGLGGLQYMLNGVRTKLGQIMDHLLVRCRTGELHPINIAKITDNRDLPYESLQMPEDSHPIAIIFLHPMSYCLDGVRMRGRTKIRLRCLEMYGITPIPVSYHRWLELQDCERVPYLTCKIDECVPASSLSSSRGKSR